LRPILDNWVIDCPGNKQLRVAEYYAPRVLALFPYKSSKFRRQMRAEDQYVVGLVDPARSPDEKGFRRYGLCRGAATTSEDFGSAADILRSPTLGWNTMAGTTIATLITSSGGSHR
jgi:hypothetical protein